jgi:hypothetical protein
MKTGTIEIRELGGPFREVYSGDIGLATGADGSPPRPESQPDNYGSVYPDIVGRLAGA